MRIARKLKVAAVLGVAATMALTACTQKSQSGGGTEGGGVRCLLPCLHDVLPLYERPLASSCVDLRGLKHDHRQLRSADAIEHKAAAGL